MDKWLVLKTKSNCERIAEIALFRKEIQSFVPRFRQALLPVGRQQRANKPVFPGYVFVHPASNQINQLDYIPGSCGLVLENGRPGIVTEREIQSIQSLISGPSPVEVHPQFEIGEQVIVVDGPFRGLVGTVVCLKRSTRFIIRAALLKACLSVEIDPKCIAKGSAMGPVYASN